MADEKPAEKPVETPAATPVETPVAKPAEKPTETPAAAASAAAPKDTPPPRETTVAASADRIVPDYSVVKFPEGTLLDASDLALVVARGQALGLSVKDTQELATLQSVEAQHIAERGLAEVKADPELGGTHYEETERLVKAGRNWLAPPGSRAAQRLVQFFDKTGLGNDVEIVRMLARIGREVSEDRGAHLGAGPRPSPNQRTAAELLYDHPTSQTS